MKCMECGADIFEGVKKCPYCKTPTVGAGNGEKFKNFDFKYTITSADQMEKIKESAKAEPKRKKKESLLDKVEGFLAKRRAAKRAAKRAVRRGEDPKAAVQKLEAKDSTDPFVRDTAVNDSDAEAIGTYKRVRPGKASGKSAKESVWPRRSGKNRKRNKQTNKKERIRMYVFRGAVVAVAALLVYLIVLFFMWIFGDEVVGSYAYVKDNALYVSYDGENITLTKNVISEDYIRKLNEMENPPSVDSIIRDENLVHTSKDGKITYFFENYDPETDSGRLKVIFEGDDDDIVTVSEAVHNSIVMSGDGDKLLYLRALEPETQMGVLYFWEEGEEPRKLVPDIDPYLYQFSQDDEWALFLQTYRRAEQSGDLYAISLDDPDEEKTKIDSDVCKLFGSDGDGEYHIYGKEYDETNRTFDVYSVDEDGETRRLGERTIKDPWILGEEERVLILGDDGDGNDTTNVLFSVEIGSGKKNKIDSGVNRICMVSEDEETIVYEKIYNERISDYYAYREGKQSSKIAPNIVVDKETIGGYNQFAANSDCEEFLYISSFDEAKQGGTLIHCVYDGEIVQADIIAEVVRSCYVTDDDMFVFTKNYSPAKNCFDVYAFDGDEEIPLKEGIIPEKFGVDKKENNIYFISDYNMEKESGVLERMDMDGESQVLSKNVYSFVISDETGDVLIKKNYNSEKQTFDLYLLEEGDDEELLLNSSVSELLQP